MSAPPALPLLPHDDVGNGVPLLLVHAFPLHRGMWRPVIAGLASEARCLAPDLPGFGANPEPGLASMQAAADALARLLDAADEERAVVCGLSMGGYAALALWRHHPARVRALVLADTRAGADDAGTRETRDRTITVAREQGAAAAVGGALDRLLGASTRERAPEVVDTVRALLAEARADGVAAATAAMRDRPDASDLLGGITVPTLVIVGEEDEVTPPDEARRLAGAIPGAQLEVIPRAGHLTALERPAAFTHAVRDFLRALPAGTA